MKSLTACTSSNGANLERTRFFPRQLITPDDLTQDQIYFREKMRRHNRLLHGWGVVCGLRVRQGEGDCEIEVEQGYALSPQGDEILVDEQVTMDLCLEDINGNAVSACGNAMDPWCSDVRVNRRPEAPLYVAIRYDECLSRPVRVHTNGCGCDEGACEHSRIREGYALKVLTTLPSHYPAKMSPPSDDEILSCGRKGEKEELGRPCPDCTTEPWVILAKVMLGTDGKIADIDCFSYRRYVVSFADFYYMCQDRDREDERRRLERQVEVLEDQKVEAKEAQMAKAMVALVREDGSQAYMPAHFAFNRDETYAEFLAREGEREFYDPATEERITLRDMYAMAGVDLGAPVRSVTDALSPLEGMTLSTGSLRRTRAELDELVVDAGLQRLESDYGGSPAKAADLPATDIQGVSSRSTLGRHIAGMTVADVANTDRETFIAEAVGEVPDRRKSAVENQAGQVWDNADRINYLSNTWSG